MSRFSRGGEVASKHSDKADRRTVPGDLKPRSPAQIDALYAKGRTLPLGRGGKTHEHQANQFPEDKHDDAKGPSTNGYQNEVPATSWLRGGGEGHRPNMDTGKLDPSSKIPKPAAGLKATGKNMEASPFSKAHNTYGEG
jgi:hypothetical protein